MTLHAEEFALSGTSSLAFDAAAERLLELAADQTIVRLTVTGDDGPQDFSSSAERCLGEVSAVGGFDVSKAHRIDFVYDLPMDRVQARVRISVIRARHTLIQGQPFVAQLLSDADAPVPTLEALAAWLVSLSRVFACPVLGIGLENFPQDTVDAFGEVLTPHLLAIVPTAIIDPLRHRFEGTGARIDDYDTRVVVWLVEPQSFVIGGTPSSVARSEVAALTAGAVPI